MPGIINSTTFPDLVENLEVKWRKAYDAFPKVAGLLYEIEDTDIITGDESSFDTYSVARKKQEGDEHAFLSVAQGYRKSWRVYEVSGMTKITWLMREGNKYGEINKKISGLAQSTAKRWEWDLTHRFTFAWSTSYTDIDGDTVDTTIGDTLAFMSSAHTVTDSATTFRNAIANNPPISKSGIEAGEKLFATQMIDNNGESIFPQPDTLVTTNDPTIVNIALQYLKSYADIDGAHAGIVNPFMGRYRLVVLPYLATTAAGVYDSTKAGYWFLLDVANTDAFCKVLARPTFIPPTQYDGMEFETMDWKFATHGSWAIEILRAQWAVGSKGDSSA